MLGFSMCSCELFKLWWWETNEVVQNYGNKQKLCLKKIVQLKYVEDHDIGWITHDASTYDRIYVQIKKFVVRNIEIQNVSFIIPTMPNCYGLCRHIIFNCKWIRSMQVATMQKHLGP